MDKQNYNIHDIPKKKPFYHEKIQSNLKTQVM